MLGAALQGIFHFDGTVRIAVIAAGTLVLAAAMWLSLTLRPLDGEKRA